MNEKPKTISLIIPVLNEEDTVAGFIAEVAGHLSDIRDYRFEYIFVDDGSTDNTLPRLREFAASGMPVQIIELSRNFGKEAALSAGIDHAGGDAVIPIDVDLQDPPHVIVDMIAKWEDGWEVVLAQRSDRSNDSLAKSQSARLFYWIHNRFSSPGIPTNCGDFRLMDKVVVAALRRLPENQRFMKGLFAWVGFRTTSVSYVRETRSAGQSKFNFGQLLDFAIQGFTSFSLAPLRLWHILGLVVSLMSLVFATFIVVRVLVYGIDVPGYASLMVVLLFLGGMQLIGIGVLGEYLGRSYFESKRRPVYIIRKIHSGEDY
ncbi:glycosyltransferase family 2 protein [Alphaproteobacteria bacterium LSUCC0719]